MIQLSFIIPAIFDPTFQPAGRHGILPYDRGENYSTFSINPHTFPCNRGNTKGVINNGEIYKL